MGYFIKPSTSEPLSVLYILGFDHTLNSIPFNVKSGQEYSVYLGINNKMGRSMYYTSMLKLGNASDPLPLTSSGIYSPLPALNEFRSFLRNGETSETPLTFQINKLTIADQISYLPSVTINGVTSIINKSSIWDTDRTGYYYNLIFELWVFNPASNMQEFSQRSVHLLLNVTL